MIIREQDAVESVYRCIGRTLLVPRVYFQKPILYPIDGRAYDLVVIDRDGQGDAHVAEIKKSAKDAITAAEQLKDSKIPAPYRWVAYIDQPDPSDLATVTGILAGGPFYAPEGVVGLINIFRMTSDQVGANVVIPARRFPGNFYDQSRQFSAAKTADVQA